jgi:pyruvate-formate lyase-activating enzyme
MAPTMIAQEGSHVWSKCAFLTCSVLPVRRACNCRCPFCFSRSSISALEGEFAGDLELDGYFAFARERGAARLVVTGGGEPLLRKEWVLRIVRAGREWFPEIALFTNASFLDPAYAAALAEAGLSYLCYSRHHYDDEVNRTLMGAGAPDLEAVLAAAGGVPIRATCVMARGFIDTRDAVFRYVEALARRGVRQFTFKHTYVAYPGSVFAASPEDRWAAEHRVDFDPFAGEGQVLASLPWGPCIRRLGDLQVCYYWEPTPAWEKEHRLCRSVNLLSDGKVYASLEEAASFLFQLGSSRPPSLRRT